MGITTQSSVPLVRTDDVGKFYPAQSERYRRVVTCAACIILTQGYESESNWLKLLVQLGLRQTRPQDIRLFWFDVILKLFDYYRDRPIEGAIRQIKEHMTAAPQKSLFPTKQVILEESIPSKDERWRMYILLNDTLQHADSLAQTLMVDRPSWFNAVHELADAAFASCFGMSPEGEPDVETTG